MSHAASLLVVEDEPKIARLMADYLTTHGFEVTTLGHGDEVMPWLEQHSPALVLLDIMLPGKDGLTLSREIRQLWPSIAIIMVTAKVEEVDRLLGLLAADRFVWGSDWPHTRHESHATYAGLLDDLKNRIDDRAAVRRLYQLRLDHA